jgi:cbb3-type cytochrome oxidase subunit 3
MDINDLRSIVTVLAFLRLSSASCWWAWSGRRRAAFDEAARLPFTKMTLPPMRRGKEARKDIMSDFVSGFWSVYVALITLVSVVGCGVLLWSQGKARTNAAGQSDTTGHVWDEDLQEYNQPLPRWWSWLFYITVVFSLGYLAVYPGLGSYEGAFGWSSRGEYEAR